MSDSVYVGMNAGGLETAPAFEPISKIVLYVDDEHAYEAGNDTGRTMEITCPYGTQEMANNLLDQLGGYTYQPAQATDALMDPAAELGDAVTIGGVYTVLASVTTAWDRLMTADIGAPGQAEIDSEYPYISRQTSQNNYQLATLRSLITKTSEDITLRVNGLENQYTELKVTVDGVTVSGEGGVTLIKGSSIQTSTLAANSISASAVNLTGSITFEDLSSSVQNDINDAYSTAQAADTAASDANDRIEAWSYNGGTRIDGTMIATGTVTASTLRGGTVEILTSSEMTAGTLTVRGASSATYAITLASNGALSLEAGFGALHLEGGGGEIIDLDDGYIGCGRTLRPAGDSAYDVGTASWRWRSVYAETGTIQTSDRNYKTDIDYDMSRYEGFFDSLRPASCKFIDGTSGRTHVVLVSQDVEQALTDNGLTSMDFAGFIKSPKTDKYGQEYEDEFIYSLRYDEFVGLLIGQVQSLKKRVDELEDTA